YIKFLSSFLFSFPIPVHPPSPSIPNRKTPITAARGVRDCFFSGRPLWLCESRGMLNIPLLVRAQSGRQTILVHCEFKMKSQGVMKLSYPPPSMSPFTLLSVRPFNPLLSLIKTYTNCG